jgi:hypothetical protein
MLAIGLTTAAMGCAHDYLLWLVLRGLAGIASAWVMIYVSSWALGQLAAMGKPALSGRIFAGVGLGILAAGLASLAMMSAHWSADAAWIALGAGALLVAAMMLRTLVAPTSTQRRVSEPARSESMRWTSEALRLVGCFATSGFGYIIPATFLPAMARGIIADPAVFGWSWPVFGAAAMLSTFAAARLRAVGHRRLWIFSQLLMAAGVAVPVLWHGMVAIIVSGVLVGGTFMVITMAALSEAKAIAGAQAVGLLSAMTAAFAVGQLLGPVSVRLLVDTGRGFDMALLMASGVLVAGSYILSRRPHERAYLRPPQDLKLM